MDRWTLSTALNAEEAGLAISLTAEAHAPAFPLLVKALAEPEEVLAGHLVGLLVLEAEEVAVVRPQHGDAAGVLRVLTHGRAGSPGIRGLLGEVAAWLDGAPDAPLIVATRVPLVEVAKAAHLVVGLTGTLAGGGDATTRLVTLRRGVARCLAGAL